MKTMKTKRSNRKNLTEVHLFTLSEIARTFTEWERRYRENPEKYKSEAEKLLKDTPKTYGEACGPYFLKLKREICGEVVCR